MDYEMDMLRYITTIEAKEGTNDREKITKFVKESINLEPLEIQPDLLSEDNIKELHAIIADNILDKDAGVNPGENRIDSRHVGYNMLFPAPESIPSSMKLYLNRSNELIRNINFTKPMDYFNNDECVVFLTAAIISYEFVRIHPFPDFNGRISRILLMMILHLYRLPFYLTLRGNKKGRNRYLRALKSANSGDFKPYATLIAMNVVESFREIDETIKLAGLTPLSNIN
jgi:Fic family protein